MYLLHTKSYLQNRTYCSKLCKSLFLQLNNSYLFSQTSCLPIEEAKTFLNFIVFLRTFSKVHNLEYIQEPLFIFLSK